MMIRIAALLALSTPALAGPFSNFDDGVAADDVRIAGWATSVDSIDRGPTSAADPSSGLASFGEPVNALGAAGVNGLVSLGDGGSITLGFTEPIADLEGPDLAVFENPFEFGGSLFAELAFVEVSSDGANFFRFDAVSLTQATTQLGAFSGIDATDVNNLAGKHLAGIGTPFDLAELVGVSTLLDTNAVTHVRLVDVVGSIDPAFGSVDSLGTLINDPFPTNFASSGFDVDAVAVLRPIPEPTAALLLLTGWGLRARRR